MLKAIIATIVMPANAGIQKFKRCHEDTEPKRFALVNKLDASVRWHGGGDS
jgi:hypothetical protein